jgi:hypothetical protein
VLPHVDLVVCLDGLGGIAAACPPSELAAALALSMHESSKEGYGSDSKGNTTDEESNNGSQIGGSLEGSLEELSGNKDGIKRITSNGFFELLSALPRMNSTARLEGSEDGLLEKSKSVISGNCHTKYIYL